MANESNSESTEGLHIKNNPGNQIPVRFPFSENVDENIIASNKTAKRDSKLKWSGTIKKAAIVFFLLCYLILRTLANERLGHWRSLFSH